jgi:hypothetical protein
MKSPVIKRTVYIDGRKTGVACLAQAVDHKGGDGLECDQLGGFKPPVI